MINAEVRRGWSPKFKLIVLPWVVFLFAVVLYTVVISIGLLSQLLRVSLPSHHSINLMQGNVSTFDMINGRYYFQVEVNTDVGGHLILGFMDTSSGQFVFNRSLSQAHGNARLVANVIVPLNAPKCEEFLQYQNFRVYVLSSYVLAQPKESSCIAFNSKAVIIPEDEVVSISVYTGITYVQAKFKSATPSFFFGLTLTSFLYACLLWLRRSFRATIVFYIVLAVLFISCMIVTFASANLKLESLVIVFILSIIPLIHLFILFILAHRTMRSEHNTENGYSLFHILRVGNLHQVAPAPVPLIQTNINKTDICKYYCPICMVYHDCIYRTVCCSQYVCRSCLNDFISIKAEKLSIDCPYCAVPGVTFAVVTPNEEVRNYEDSPKLPPSVSVRSIFTHNTSSASINPLKLSSSSTSSSHSLKRKLVPHASSGYLPPVFALASELPMNNFDILGMANPPFRAGSRTQLPRLLHHALQNSVIQSSGLSSSLGVDSNTNNNNNNNNTSGNGEGDDQNSNMNDNRQRLQIVREQSYDSVITNSDDGETNSPSSGEK